MASSPSGCWERKGKGKGKGDGGGGGGTLTVDDDVKARVVTSEVKEEEGGDEVLLNGEIKIKIRAWMMRQVVRCLEIRAAAAAADKDNSGTSTNSSSAPLSPVMKHGNCMLSLTPSQLHELQLQALIFKYIAAGLPVPPPLLLPILKTVSTSSPFVGFSTVQGFRNKDLMDPEPWRCRRTDGKKWRCGRPVVSGQKYCERHMHRGCKRSRKPVEASQTTTANSDEVNNLLPQDSQFTIVPSNNSSKNSENSIPNQFNLTPLSSQRTDLSLSNNAMVRSPAGNGNGDLKITGITMSLVADADPQETTSTTVATGTILGLKSCLKTTVSTETTNGRVASNNKNKCSRTSADRDGIDDWTSNFSFTVSCKNIVNRSSSDNNNNKILKNVARNVSQVLDFSPKSVLQVHGSSSVELESGRCRRTDGKKWRCRRDAVSNQKYCGMHLHRGAKKRSKSSEFDVSSNSNQHTKVILPNKADCTNLSTDLSISIAMSPPLVTTDHTSSSSDATISDTIVSAHDS